MLVGDRSRASPGFGQVCGLSTKTTGQPSAELFPCSVQCCHWHSCTSPHATISSALPLQALTAIQIFPFCRIGSCCEPQVPGAERSVHEVFGRGGWWREIFSQWAKQYTGTSAKDILIRKVEIIGSLALSGHGKKPTASLQGNQSSLHSVAHLISILSSLSCCYLPPAEEKGGKEVQRFYNSASLCLHVWQEMDSKKLPIKL